MQNKAEKIIVELFEDLAFSDSPIMKEGDNSEDDGKSIIPCCLQVGRTVSLSLTHDE